MSVTLPNSFGSRGLRIANRGSGFCFEAFSPRGWTAKIKVRDVPHGAFTVTGDKTLRLLTVHIVDKGKPLYIPAKP
jgi:hypothetical protein